MDESRYILDCIDGRQRVQQLRSENIHDDCIQETTQGGGSSVMVWAEIHYGCKTPLVVLEGNNNAVVHQDILKNHCFPHARRVHGNNFGLKDDNAKAHRAAAVREFIDAERVQQMPWPACSPNMNLIRHARVALGRALNESDSTSQSVQELDRDLTEEWDALPIYNINKLVDRMTFVRVILDILMHAIP